MIGKVELALNVWSLPDRLRGLNERVSGGAAGFLAVFPTGQAAPGDSVGRSRPNSSGLRKPTRPDRRL